MKRTAIISAIAAACLLGIGGFAAALGMIGKGESPAPAPAAQAPKGAPSFAWEYAGFEKDSIPRTEVSLTATYEDGTEENKLIDTIEGSCNDYADPDADVYEQSTMIICYYAGFGRYYKVIEAEGGHLVQRKEFEEASPDYDPPEAEFETIARF